MDFPDESGKPPFAKLEFLPGRKHGKTCSGRCLFSRFRGITDEQTRKDGIYTILALAELGADSLLGIRPASLAVIARFVTLTLGGDCDTGIMIRERTRNLLCAAIENFPSRGSGIGERW